MSQPEESENVSEEKGKICIICQKEYFEWGNNALPVADGQCCDVCNAIYVIPARLAGIGDKMYKGKLIKRSSRNPSNGDYECPKCHSKFYGKIEPTAYCPRCDILIEVIE